LRNASFDPAFLIVVPRQQNMTRAFSKYSSFFVWVREGKREKEKRKEEREEEEKDIRKYSLSEGDSEEATNCYEYVDVGGV